MKKQEFENLLRRLIRRIVLSEAYNRAKFINEVESKILAGFGEWSKSILAQLNNLSVVKVKGVKTDLQLHWFVEAERLIDEELFRELIKRVKGCKNKRKAVAQALQEISDANSFAIMQRASSRYVAKSFGLDSLKIKVIPEDKLQDFLKWVNSIVDIACE